MITEGEVSSLGVDHLFFDYNSMIHPCAQQVLAELRSTGLDIDCEISKTDFIESEIIANTIRYTEYVIGLLMPKNIHIMIDGVAPRAKINQQRERRYKSYFFKKIGSDGQSAPSHSQPLGCDQQSVTWDSNKITPGTAFMEKLICELNNFIESYNQQNESQIYLSDSDSPGEGEHKMMKYINNNITTPCNICIYGLDADLIMLSLKSVRCDSIILLRDNTFNTQLRDENRTFTYLDIKTLKGCVYTDMRNQVVSSVDLRIDNVIDDYIFLCFLLGNDFLEHLPNLLIKENGVNALLKVYIKYLNNGRYLTRGGVIDTKLLFDILVELSKTETYFFQKVWSVYQKKVTKTPECDECYTYPDGSPMILFQKEDCIKYNTDDYKNRYYLYYGIGADNVDDACEQYLLGLHWVWGYYNNHEHDNWTWYYPYHATPFVSDLVNYLRKTRHDFKNTQALLPSRPNTTIEQLCMVLPRESLLGILKEDNQQTHIYEKLSHFFRSDSKDAQCYFPQTIFVDLIHKEQLWQSKVLFEHFNKKILHLLIEKE
jgi:5'-3' exoribonuclease 1